MLPDDIVFSMDGESYRWRDIILAAVRRGDWQAVQRRASEGTACIRHAHALDDPIPPAALDSAATEFRYARDLITAQSMEDWLERWGLSVAEWTAFFQRELVRDRYGANLEVLARRYPVSDQEAPRLTLIEAICSGELERWSRVLASRAAIHVGLGSAADAGEPRDSGDGPRTDGFTEHAQLASAFGWSDNMVGETLHRLDAIDESFERFRSTQLTDRALEDYVSRRQLDWIQFGCRMMSFPDEAMAAEAAMLMREDGERFTGVYRTAHVEPRSARFFLDQIDTRIRDRFIGARPGDLLGPLRLDDRYFVYQIEEKLLPTASNPEVRRRAEEGVLRNALSRQLDQQIQWHATPTP